MNLVILLLIDGSKENYWKTFSSMRNVTCNRFKFRLAIKKIAQLNFRDTLTRSIYNQWYKVKFSLKNQA